MGHYTGIELYAHNQEAYDKLCILLKKYKKACIVHPTGTGKSFIAFKLIEQNPDKKVLWLSPSNVIFNTQVSGLIDAVGKESADRILGNVKELNYALLTRRKRISRDMKGDIIILDEFHRCGAPAWGKMVKRLFEANKDAVIIGLSATHIRYLDSGRNMADELFDGIIASKMTLNEAIEKGILKAPRYIVTWGDHDEEELKKINEENINIQNILDRKSINKNIRKINKNLSKTLGIRDILSKYIKPGGKYIVFCSGIQQIDELEPKLHGWVSKIDSAAKIYKVTWRDRAGKTLQRFKLDDSAHIKLLMCINMLTEGYHLKDIDGIIMLRLTKSPNIYIQQIGRIMSAASQKDPVIIDLANNYMTSLNTIGIKRNYVRLNACKKETVLVESKQGVRCIFELIDEAKSSREVLYRIKNLLTDEWEAYYLEARSYYEKNGNLSMGDNYISESGLSLGMWLQVQKRLKNGKLKGGLSDEKIRLLERIGIEWKSKSNKPRRKKSWIYRDFDTAIYYLQGYIRIYGNALVPYDFEVNGFKLGHWVSEARQKYCDKFNWTQEKFAQKKQLDEIGFIWSSKEYKWDIFYKWLTNYQEERGVINIPRGKYILGKNGDVYIWLVKQLKLAKEGGLPEEKVLKLEKLNICIEKDEFIEWNEGYEIAKAFYEKYGTLDLSGCYVRDRTFNIHKWLRRQRRLKRYLSDEQIKKLDDIGMVWVNHPHPRNHALINLRELEKYYEEHGNIDIPETYITESGIMLGLWLHHQKEIKRQLSDRRVAILEGYGIDWTI